MVLLPIFKFILFLFLTSSLYAETCQRIVSIAPSITEIIYQLDLSDNLIAVSRFDQYPEDVKNKIKIGSFLDLNFEHLYGLKPSILFGLKANGFNQEKLDQLNINHHLFSHKSFKGIFDSILEIGEICNKQQLAKNLVSEMQSSLNQYQQEFPSKIKVLLVVSTEERNLKNFYLSGNDGIYFELLKVLGAENIVKEKTVALPAFSKETIYHLDPDLIIEIHPKNNEYTKDQILKPWKSLSDLRAIKNRQVYLINSDYAIIPGPRIVKILKDFSRILKDAREYYN